MKIFFMIKKLKNWYLLPLCLTLSIMLHPPLAVGSLYCLQIPFLFLYLLTLKDFSLK